MENKQYVLANIQIPMEVNTNGSFDPLPEYINIIFEKIDNLPQKSGMVYNNEYVRNQILSIFTSKNKDNLNNAESTSYIEASESSPIVSYDELLNRQHRTHNKNISFKSKKKSTARYTSKNYL